MINDYFRVTGAHDTVLDYADLFSVTLHDDNIQEFDTRWESRCFPSYDCVLASARPSHTPQDLSEALNESFAEVPDTGLSFGAIPFSSLRHRPVTVQSVNPSLCTSCVAKCAAGCDDAARVGAGWRYLGATVWIEVFRSLATSSITHSSRPETKLALS